LTVGDGENFTFPFIPEFTVPKREIFPPGIYHA
jgi:hypothetical protein